MNKLTFSNYSTYRNKFHLTATPNLVISNMSKMIFSDFSWEAFHRFLFAINMQQYNDKHDVTKTKICLLFLLTFIIKTEFYVQHMHLCTTYGTQKLFICKVHKAKNFEHLSCFFDKKHPLDKTVSILPLNTTKEIFSLMIFLGHIS